MSFDILSLDGDHPHCLLCSLVPIVCKKRLVISLPFSGPYRDAAQLKRKTMMDDKKDPLGLQEGPFSFSKVRFNSLAVSVTYYSSITVHEQQLSCTLQLQQPKRTEGLAFSCTKFRTS